MKTLGIVAEYNPLHNGHIYQLKQAVRIAGSDAVVIAMSGDYVQRGEPAIFDKWTRAEHALSCGADLVVEIPTAYCLGNAGQFASAGVTLLESLGSVDHIAFGSECGDPDVLIAAAGFLKEHDSEIQELIKTQYQGLSYPAARARACSQILDRSGSTLDLTVLNDPNDILGLEYIKAMKTAVPVVIRREGAGHHTTDTQGSGFISASGIRALLNTNSDTGSLIDSIQRQVPETTVRSIRNDKMTFPRDWWDTLRYAVISCDASDIDECPSGGEGLGNLMKREITGSGSWDDFVTNVKSKRYTYTRISRLCMQIILGIRRSMVNSGGPEYIRVLGFTAKGRQLLSEVRSNEIASLPVITNVNKVIPDLTGRAAEILASDIHCADIYNLVTGRSVRDNSDHVHKPVLK